MRPVLSAFFYSALYREPVKQLVGWPYQIGGHYQHVNNTGKAFLHVFIRGIASNEEQVIEEFTIVMVPMARQCLVKAKLGGKKQVAKGLNNRLNNTTSTKVLTQLPQRTLFDLRLTPAISPQPCC